MMLNYLFEIRMFSRVVLVLFAMSLGVGVHAQSLAQLADAKPSVALSKANEVLEQNPNDEASLFIRARALKNLGNIDQAKQIYQLLIQRRPQSPEPYVNLAAIQSEQGDIKQAQETLIAGLNANDGYARLYAGLKNINGQLAAQAYQQALNKEIKTQPIQLALAQRMAIPQPIIQEKEVIREVIKEVPVEVVKEVIKEVPVEVIKEVIKEVPVAASVAVAKVEEPTNSQQTVDAELNAIVREWAKAWSAQDVPAFTQFYTAGYTSKPTMSHQAWLQDRQLKITNKEFIDVSVDDLVQQSRDGGEIIDVIFMQSYRSNTVSDTIKKRLSFIQEAGVWKIAAERVVGR